VLHLDLIAEIYPDARFVHIVRDGRDVARSIAVQSWGPDSIEEAAQEWREAIMASRAAAISDDRYREVRYEDMLSDPSRVAAELYRFLGLSADDEIVGLAVSEARISANLGTEPSAVGTEKWRRALSQADLETFDRVAGDVLAELSYPPSDPSTPAAPIAPPADAARSRGGPLQRALAKRRAREEPRYRQELVDDLVEALRAGSSDRLVALMTEDAMVRIVSRDDSVEGRAERGREILREFLATDKSLEGRQLRGDVFPSLPYTGLLLSHAGADGRPTSHVAFIRLADDRVRELIVYRL
jgi:ketosteroid isomerase-like protein